MGKGDKKTRRGKIFKGSFGVSRSRTKYKDAKHKINSVKRKGLKKAAVSKKVASKTNKDPKLKEVVEEVKVARETKVKEVEIAQSKEKVEEKVEAKPEKKTASKKTNEVEDKKVDDKKVEDKKVEDKKVEDKKVEDKKVEDKKTEVKDEVKTESKKETKSKESVKAEKKDAKAKK